MLSCRVSQTFSIRVCCWPLSNQWVQMDRVRGRMRGGRLTALAWSIHVSGGPRNYLTLTKMMFWAVGVPIGLFGLAGWHMFLRGHVAFWNSSSRTVVRHDHFVNYILFAWLRHLFYTAGHGGTYGRSSISGFLASWQARRSWTLRIRVELSFRKVRETGKYGKKVSKCKVLGSTLLNSLDARYSLEMWVVSTGLWL